MSRSSLALVAVFVSTLAGCASPAASYLEEKGFERARGRPDGTFIAWKDGLWCEGTVSVGFTSRRMRWACGEVPSVCVPSVPESCVATGRSALLAGDPETARVHLTTACLHGDPRACAGWDRHVVYADLLPYRPALVIGCARDGAGACAVLGVVEWWEGRLERGVALSERSCALGLASGCEDAAEFNDRLRRPERAAELTARAEALRQAEGT